MAGEKILDIDDSPTVQRLIEMILSSQGYQVVLASDGEEGIAKAKSERPALILVDFVMPKMNGFQVCKTLKDDPEFKDTPIILVTSKGDKVGSKFVDVLGISEYFTKPFQPEELLAKIREVLDKAPAIPAPAAAASPATGTSRTAAASAPPAAGQQQNIDTLVKDITERVLSELRSSVLPDLIRRELTGAGTAGTAAAGPKNEAGIRGDLSSFRIVEVMQMLGLQRQTGRLAVSGTVCGDLLIYFREGTVSFATSHCNGTPSDALVTVLKRTCRLDEAHLQHYVQVASTSGEPLEAVLAREKVLEPRSFADCLKRHTESTVHRAMALKKGSFVFDKSALPAFSSPLHLKVDDLLLEGARRSDEWVLIQQKIPSFDVVFETMIGNAEELSTRGLSELDTRVFSLIDGKRSVRDIIDELCLGEFEVTKSLFILLSVNLIRQRM